MSTAKHALLSLGLSSAISFLAGGAGDAAAEQAAVEAEAAKLLKNSMEFLAAQQRFALSTESWIEVVLNSGQKLQFHNAIDVAVQRPNKMHARRNGESLHQEFFYDGKSLTLYDAPAGFHATIDAPDTLEGMLDFARNTLDIEAPGGDFIYSNAYEILMDNVDSGFVVGRQAVVEGRACDHLAFSAPATDWQIWIERGDRPLPRRIVITSKDILNAPQFTVSIRDWNLSPDLSEEQFTYGNKGKTKAIDFAALIGADDE